MPSYDNGTAPRLPVQELDETMMKDAKVLKFRKNIMNECKSAWLTLLAWLKNPKQ